MFGITKIFWKGGGRRINVKHMTFYPFQLVSNITVEIEQFRRRWRACWIQLDNLLRQYQFRQNRVEQNRIEEHKMFFSFFKSTKV